ncbi:MAG: hypothetical protein JWN48_802 [Myxococcaceae bacterium]|nr:hypothetical protein [Myxococcaceae bacterium]
MLNESLVERALVWLTREWGEGPAQTARKAFEAATGAIEEAAPDFEARIAHFLEQYLCDGEPAPVSVVARADTSLREHERRELAGWLRSHRSLFAFEELHGETGLVRDCIGGGLFEFAASEHDRRLAAGEYFDGRLIPLGDRLWLSPGRVYHPHEAHDALKALLSQLQVELAPRAALLNGLLAMRTRFLTFESVRAEHVYQARALAPVHLPVRAG